MVGGKGRACIGQGGRLPRFAPILCLPRLPVQLLFRTLCECHLELQTSKRHCLDVSGGLRIRYVKVSVGIRVRVRVRVRARVRVTKPEYR